MTPETIGSNTEDFIRQFSKQTAFKPVSYKDTDFDQTCVTVNVFTRDCSYVSNTTSLKGLVIHSSNHTEKRKLIGFSLHFSKENYDKINSKKIFYLLFLLLRKGLSFTRKNWQVLGQIFYLVIKNPRTWVIV